jgi:hypothetical protein
MEHTSVPELLDALVELKGEEIGHQQRGKQSRAIRAHFVCGFLQSLVRERREEREGERGPKFKPWQRRSWWLNWGMALLTNWLLQNLH